jgi:D-2-hydroxyacid dehydrogenase (NADP+)
MSRMHVLEFVRDTQGVWNLPPHHMVRLRAEFPSIRFTSPRDQEEADRLLPEADVVFGWAVRPSNFDHASRLRWIHVSAAGVSGLLFPALVESPVVVTNGRGLHGIAMAEHAIGVLLAFARKLHLARDAQREGRWEQDRLSWEEPPFGELVGTTLGLVGLGSVGSAIAERARALGMHVIAVRKHPASSPSPAHAQWAPDRMDELLEAADWVVLALPLTGETRELIGARELQRMRPHAILVNLGRGGLVHEGALIDALEAGRIAGAALDVFEREPLSAESALWRMPQVILTPHISGLGPRYWERSVDLFRENLVSFAAGKPLRNQVDKSAGY